MFSGQKRQWSDDNKDQWSDEELWRAFANGDNEAFDVFFVRDVPTLYRTVAMKCTFRSVPIDLAEDFVQQALAAAIAKVHSDPVATVNMAWLTIVANRRITDWMRKNGRYTSQQDDFDPVDEQRGFDEEFAQHDELRTFLGWLGHEEREIIDLVVVRECKFAEAGKQLGCSEEAAKKRYYRAMVRIRELVAEHGMAESKA